jgi:secreted trypsin-like serine protease
MSELPDEKTYDTFVVATALTGIGLGPCSYSDIMDVYSMLLGYHVWTHELAHSPTIHEVRDEGYRQFPNMPTGAVASADWEKARDIAVAEYGHFVTVKRGNSVRRESPVATLGNMLHRRVQ